MKKFLPFIAILLVLPVVLASMETSVEEEIQKATHYAEEYETGNIDFVRFLLYMSNVRQGLNKLLGATDQHEGGLLGVAQIEEALGPPTKWTRWAWNEWQKTEQRLDEPAPVWTKIIFDGDKIQIRMEAHPFILLRLDPELEKQIWQAKETGDFELVRQLKNQGKEELVYNLHFNTEFKRPQEEMDMQSKIENIKGLADIFNSAPTNANAEELAKEAVNTERTFETYYKQNPADCEELMASIFGSENLRDQMNTVAYEIIFYEGENYDAIIRLEMCEDCEWNWINMNMWIESRGPFRHPEDVKDPAERESRERFKGMDSEGFKSETLELLGDIKEFFDKNDLGPALAYANRLSTLTQVWTEEANNVWPQIDQEFEAKRKGMSEEEEHALWENYGWIAWEKEKRQRAKELREQTFRERQQFYSGLFSDYDKTESHYEQTEFVRRLIEEFKEFGEEICDNGKDDNKNSDIDCADSQCGGKICGRDTIEFLEANETNKTTTKTIDLYCIAGDCQTKVEIIEPTDPICGNHVCEEGEAICSSSLITCNILDNATECSATADCGPIYCVEDCILCVEHPALECAGKVIFSGQDENGCPLEPICVEEDIFCEIDEDCKDPLCGKASCVEGICELINLKNCTDAECVEGDKQIERCSSGKEIIKAICVNSIWENTGVVCDEEDIICCEEIGAVDSVIYVWLDKSRCVGGGNKARKVVDAEYCKSEECVEEGSRTFAGDPNCCEGLDAVSDCLPNQDCPISVRYCVDCGNGNCDSHENWDNCAGDCGKEESFGCTKCGNSCISMQESMRADCAQPTEEFECVEEQGQCIKEEKESIIGDECIIREDCGGENDVCSNGKCVTLPKIIPVEPGEPPKIPDEEEEGEQETEDSEPEEQEEVVEEEVPEPEPEEVNEGQESLITGEAIFGLFRALFSRLGMTGAVTEGEGDDSDNVDEESDASGDDGGDDGGDDSSSSSSSSSSGGGEEDDWDGECPDAGDPPEVKDNCWYEEKYDNQGCVSGYNVECGEWEDNGGGGDDSHDGGKDNWEEDDWEEKKGEECKEECRRKCYDMEIRPCVEECIMEECGEDFDCEAQEVTKTCENRCEGEKDTKTCEEDCHPRCVKGEDVWEEPEREENKEHKNMFEAGGGCRTSQQGTEAFIWMNGWGTPFDQIESLKQKYYRGGEADWCKRDLENLQRQRQEFEKGFNQEFLGWFFNDYMANSAQDWEAHMSGIYEIYWSNVDILRETVHRMQCLGLKELPDYNLIGPIEFESDYGYLKFWEEKQTVKMPEIEGKIEMIVPYMQIWVSPPEEFIRYEMEDAMQERRAPGPPEERSVNKEGGLTQEQRNMLREDKKFMENVDNLLEDYGGSFSGAMQIVDFETGDVVYNMYIQINKEDLITIEPMLPEQMPAYDLKMQIDFTILLDIINAEEDMRGIETESPPWGERKQGAVQQVKKVVNGIQMYLKFRKLQSTSKIEPESAKGYVKDIFMTIMDFSMGGDKGPKDKEDFNEEEFKKTQEENNQENGEGQMQSLFTGNMISRF